MSETGRAGAVLRGLAGCAGLGFLAGGVEAFALGAASSQAGSAFFAWASVIVLATGSVGLLLGAVASPLALLRDAGGRAVQPALVGVALSGAHLWPRAVEGASQGRWIAAALFGALPLAIGAAVLANARYWLRRAETRPVRGWVPGSLLAGLALGASGAAVHAARAPSPWEGVGVVLVTVDGLRRDDVGAYGAVATPHLDALAARGVVFDDAVTALPDSLAANASALTGLHPLRHGVLRDGDALAGVSIARVARDAGIATAAFVSGPALRGAGLDQGFRTYDDGGSLLTRSVLGRFTARRSRGATSTVDAVLAAPRAGLTWVHLVAEPGVDAEIGRLLDATADRAAIVVGTHGVMRGEHGLHGAVGLYDEVVRVPLLVSAPAGLGGTRVAPQVRVLDVAPTALALLGVDHPGETEGVDVLEYARGRRRTGMWSALVGRGGDDLAATPLIGMRNNGLKYVREVRTGRELLFDLAADPAEAADLSAGQPEAVESARGMLAPDEAALLRLVGG